MIFDGKNTSKNILESLKSQVSGLNFVPEFSDILVGQDGPSIRYVNKKKQAATDLGIRFIDSNFDENVKEEEIINKIKELSMRPNMCGIIVQLPLPAHINTENVLNSVPINLDVDCLSRKYSDEFYSKNNFENILLLPTVLAILTILNIAETDIIGKNIVIVGQGRLVGRPLYHVLSSKTNLINKIDINTEDSVKKELLINADIVISAVGKPGLIKKEDLKQGVIVIDAGTMEMENTLVGDVDKDVEQIASFLTLTPGGVGPMTVAALMQNIVSVSINKSNKSHEQ